MTIFENKKLWVFIGIILIGIFLRTYNFHDWLRFSMDQSRDAQIISDAIEGKNDLPLLGPLAGGTFFHLGPAYYQLSYISAKIFGNYPDKMAYPSLFFSILAIPLFFLFLREYFNKNISLALVAIMSFSYFFVEISRFSSNPNLTPFFVLLFLYALLKIINDSDKKQWLWLILVGISLGIGVQLHTTLLVILPIFTLVLFIYLIKKRGILYLKYLLAILIISLTINTHQIISEFRTNFSNTKNFFDGIGKKGEGEGNALLKNTTTAIICQAKANVHITFSLPVIEECSKRINTKIGGGSKELYGEIKNRTQRKTTYVLNITALLIFSILGYILFAINYLKEKEKEKKNFLKIVGLFHVITFLLLIPVVASISVDYFVIISFIPLILFGLFLKFFTDKFKKIGARGMLFTIIFLAFILLRININIASEYAKGLNNNLENSDLKWAETVSEFFIKNMRPANVIYLSGEKKYIERFAGPVEYILSQKNIETIEVDISQAKEIIPPNEEFFYLKNNSLANLEKTIREFQVVNSERFNPIDIYILKNN